MTENLQQLEERTRKNSSVLKAQAEHLKQVEDEEEEEWYFDD